MTILDLAKLIIDFSNSKSTIEFRELPEDDPRKRKPDISKAKKLLGWQPEIHLEKGLMKTIEYFNNLLIGKKKANAPADNILMVNDPCVENTRKIDDFDMVRKNYV